MSVNIKLQKVDLKGYYFFDLTFNSVLVSSFSVSYAQHNKMLIVDIFSTNGSFNWPMMVCSL